MCSWEEEEDQPVPGEAHTRHGLLIPLQGDIPGPLKGRRPAPGATSPVYPSMAVAGTAKEKQKIIENNTWYRLPVPLQAPGTSQDRLRVDGPHLAQPLHGILRQYW